MSQPLVAANPDPTTPSAMMLPLLQSKLLSTVDGVVHGITSRVPGLGVADGNVGYSPPRDKQDAWLNRRQWLGQIGLNAEHVVTGFQTHGADVIVASADNAGFGAAPGSRGIGECDALVTADIGVVPMTLHADCMPILLCDPRNRVVATIHAGWRGTVANVAGGALQTMCKSFGTNPSDVLAYLGPAIGVCCYEVGSDVRDAWNNAVAAGDAALVAFGTRWRFDLAAANAKLLTDAGVTASKIERSEICTRCCQSEWFSHRAQGASTGRYGAFVAIVDR